MSATPAKTLRKRKRAVDQDAFEAEFAIVASVLNPCARA